MPLLPLAPAFPPHPAAASIDLLSSQPVIMLPCTYTPAHMYAIANAHHILGVQDPGATQLRFLAALGANSSSSHVFFCLAFQPGGAPQVHAFQKAHPNGALAFRPALRLP